MPSTKRLIESRAEKASRTSARRTGTWPGKLSAVSAGRLGEEVEDDDGEGDDGEGSRALLWAEAQTPLPCRSGAECIESTPAKDLMEHDVVSREEKEDEMNRGGMGRRRNAAVEESHSTFAAEEQGIENEAVLVIILRRTIATARAESIRCWGMRKNEGCAPRRPAS